MYILAHFPLSVGGGLSASPQCVPHLSPLYSCSRPRQSPTFYSLGGLQVLPPIPDLTLSQTPLQLLLCQSALLSGKLCSLLQFIVLGRQKQTLPHAVSKIGVVHRIGGKVDPSS